MKLKAITSAVLLTLASQPALAFAGIDPLTLNFSVNGVNKGDVEARFDYDSNEVYVDTKILKALGLSIEINELKKLTEIESVKSTFDMQKMSVNIKTDGSLIDLNQKFSMASKGDYSYTPQVDGAYLNYAVRQVDTERAYSFETGINLFDKRFHSTMNCAPKCVLGLFSMISDNEKDLTQAEVGDFISDAGDEILGATYGTQYRLNPYFIKSPSMSFNAIANNPSKVEVIIDGVTQLTKDVQPGKFSIEDIRQYQGRHNVQIQLTDAFGKSTQLNQDIFSASNLLAKDLKEYSVSAGYARKEGEFAYKDLVGSGFFRKGFTDHLTGGVNFRFAADNQIIGVEGTYLLPSGYILSGSSRVSSDKNFSLSNSISNQSQNGLFWSIGSYYSKNQRGSATSVYASAAKKIKQVSLNAAVSQQIQDKNNLTKLSVGVSTSLPQKLNGAFSTTASADSNGVFELMFGVNVALDNNMSLAAGMETKNGELSNTQSFSKSPNDPRSFAYRLSRSSSASGSANEVNVTKGFDKLIARANCRMSKELSCDGSIAGSMIYTPQTGVVLARPVRDAVLLVNAQTDGVEMGVNGTLVGKSGKSGIIVLPEVPAYSVGSAFLNGDTLKEGYTSQKASEKFLLKKYSIGMTNFGVKKVTAAFGTLIGKKSVDYTLDGKTTSFTSNAGEFYIEDIEIGSHQIKVESVDIKTGEGVIEFCNFKTGVSNEAIEDVGSISCSTTS